MSRQTRAWLVLVSTSLLLGCNGSGCKPEPEAGKLVDVQCGAYKKCPSGYECNYGGSDPKNPKNFGLCEYVECGLTDLCEKPQTRCALKVETPLCDKFDNDKYCECVRPNSEEVPSTPTTGGTPTTGDKP